MEQKVIMLDIDGVLNPSCSMADRRFTRQICDDGCVERLKRIIEATDAKIVLTSTWRFGALMPECRAFVSEFERLRAEMKLYGLKIFSVTKKLGRRDDEIMDWLEQHPNVTNWVAIDDDSFDMTSVINQGKLVHTSTLIGLQDEHIQLAINILNK
jgi:hypothetical protein